MNNTASAAGNSTCFIGIDLHCDNAVICVKENIFCSDKGVVSKTLVNKRVSVIDGADKVMELLAPYCKGRQHIAVVESTYNWYFLADAFERAKWVLRIADPSTVSQANIKAADDKTDAAYLAERLACNSLKHYKPMAKDDRDLRDLCRHRMFTVQLRAQCKITLVNYYRNHLSRKVSADKLYKRLEDDFDTQGVLNTLSITEFESAYERQVVADALERIALYNHQIDRCDKAIHAACKDLELVKICKSMPGCGPVLSAVIATEIGDINRFATAGDFVSYCRLCATSKLSNGKSKGTGNAKNGNAYLSWALTEVANIAMRSDKTTRRVYDRLLTKAKGLRVKAIRTLAAKIARGLFQALKAGQPYNVALCFGGQALEADNA